MQITPPHFLILGAQKAGTTALFTYLEHHPQITCARLKEVCFFSKDFLYNQGALQYIRYFKSTVPMEITFEATPEYLYYPFVPRRIHAHNPAIKLIVLLRDPILRAYSAWNMFRKWFDIPNKKAIIEYHLQKVNAEYRQDYVDLMLNDHYPDFHSCVVREVDHLIQGGRGSEPGFVARGLYYQQILRYFDYFERSQMLFINDDDLKNNTVDTLDIVCEFLDVKPIKWNNETLNPVHVISYEQKIDRQSIDLLRQFYHKENQLLEGLLGREFRWN